MKRVNNATVTVINLSRRVNGVNDNICDALTKELTANGKDVTYIKTREHTIEFCTNCRLCMKSPGNELGNCYIHDDMNYILDSVISSECVVVTSPINCYDLPSVMKVLLERMGVFCYWSDTMRAPKIRAVDNSIHAGILITTSAMPGIMVPLTTKARSSFRLFAKPFHVKKVRYYHFGFKGRKNDMNFSLKDCSRVKTIARKICC